MANQKLEAFVKESLQAGQSRADIKAAIEAAGWRHSEAEAALAIWSDVGFPVAVPRPTPYLSAREAFLYLFFFIVLGVLSFSLGGLLFALINYAVPEGLSGYAYDSTARAMRQGIAGLVISGPIFFWLALILRRNRRKNPEMQRSRIRKWLTYISLIVAGCTLLGDGIALLTSFLNGDLTLRFALKALVIAGIAGGIFGYFIGDAEQGDADDPAP